MSVDRFESLLGRYLSDEGSEKEYSELMAIIRQGVHDELLKSKIDAALASGSIHEEMGVERAQGILNFILAKDKQEGKEIKVVELRSSHVWRYVAAAAVLVLSVGTFWYLQQEEKPKQEITSIQQSQKLSPSVYTGKQFIHLPDGSTVVLNEGSELRYKETFGADAREVELKGEGYFDIRHDPSKPFKVLTGSVTTTVLGTAFNVKAYAGQKEIKVTVTRGKVQVSNRAKTLGIITPNEQISVNTENDSFSQSKVKAETALEWKSRYMILDDVSMEAAAAILSEKYNARIAFDNAAIKNCRITATFLNGESLEQILTVVTGVIGASYEVGTDGNVKVKGKGCE
jgi:transmembrane sensor